MLHKLRARIEEEKGFTLIELLVVVLIIGILAAIALPVFLGQQKKGQDSEAKSNARNLVSHVESCFADTQDYALCDTAAELPNTGLKIGTAVGEVGVSGATATDYTITAKSKSKSDGTATFIITKTSTGSARTCGLGGEGGCKGTSGSAGTW